MVVSESDTLDSALSIMEDTLGRIDSVRRETIKLRDNVKKVQSMLRKAKRKAAPTRKPRGIKSGFAAPVPISKALCEFLGVEHGTRMARTDVTRRVNAYIKENDLQSPEDRRVIKPDRAFSRLIPDTNQEAVTYFTLQKVLNPHFNV